MHTISTRALIDANKEALAAGSLGAQKHRGEREGAMYVYPDGCHCALGVALPYSVRSFVKLTGVNFAGINDLIYTKQVDFEHYDVARWTQTLHDSWACDMRVPAQTFGVPEPLRAFLDRYSNRIVDEQVFRAWIDLLDKTFPAEAN